MKYIILSFDDGRKDFFTNAFPVLKKYNLPATLNVITDFLGKSNLLNFASANYECITKEDLFECADADIEIACHSANHTNNLEQIVKSIDYLQKNLKLTQGRGCGFASPESEICIRNMKMYNNLIESDKVSYIRSGNQIMRDGYFHAAMYIMSKLTKSKTIFNLYNRRNIINLKKGCPSFYPSITCNADNSIKQIAFFIQTIPDNHAAIIMFHSILSPSDKGWGKDKWYNSVNDFEKLCRYLAKKKDVAVITNAKLHEMILGGKDERANNKTHR